MDESQGERSEEATSTRRDDFRRRGQVAQTRELSTALVLLVASIFVMTLSRFFLQELFELFTSSFGPGLVAAVRQGDIVKASMMAAEKLLILMAPAMAVTLLIGLGSSFVQVGFLQVEEALTPNFERLNPIEGFKKLVSLRNIFDGLKSLVKILLIGYVAYLVMKSEFKLIPLLPEMSVSEIGTVLTNLVGKLFGFVGLSVLILAIGDYGFQRWELEKRMMMTKQEVREENKSREGDPLIKARIRKIQREVANRRMIQKIPQADVVITNPTHIAVALKYDSAKAAPEVIAKGADLIAEKIKSIAKENNIPIVENKPLARTIYKTLKIGQMIPRELYVAVAEVLSYVFKLKRKLRKK